MDERHHTTDMQARYERAQHLEQGAFGKQIAFNDTLFPHWVGAAECFWYQRELKEGHEYRWVDAAAASNIEAFDHALLAHLLSQASGHAVSAEKLPLSDIKITAPQAQVRFKAFGQHWLFDTALQECARLDVCPDDWLCSPDGHFAVFTRDHNLCLHNLKSGEEKALTHDGRKGFVYAGTATVFGRQEAVSVEALWSPDSRYLLTLVVDSQEVQTGPPLVDYMPYDGTLRPQILNPDRKVGFPGDTHIEQYRFLFIEVANGEIHWADCPATPVCYPPYIGFFTAGRGWWSKDSRQAYVIDQVRGGRQINLWALDTHTGAAKILLSDISETDSPACITPTPSSHLSVLATPLPETNELVWYSERSGWAHLYLYDLSTGALKKTITSGQWLVRNVLFVDAQKRQIMVQTAGRETGRNPYYLDICRVNMDSGELSTVLASDDDYFVADQVSRASYADVAARGVSPSARFIVTTRSRVDKVPVSLLIDRDGKTVMELETADTSGLPKNWVWPEPVLLTADDDKTPIYGVIFRPADFDASKHYPVLDCTHSAFTPVGSFHQGGTQYFSAAAYAELGFIVVMFNQRGGGLRSRAFKAYQDPAFSTHPMAVTQFTKTDCIAAIRQLAERFSYMDLNRVGVAEFGSVPTALAGLLLHPDFYRVGVSMLPKTDWRMMGALGMDDGDYPSLESFAHQLEGKLLLIAGMLDDVMPIAMTLRFVEALRRANKTFDMLMLPSMGHGQSGYETRRAWDYLVTHLLETEPPVDFELKTGLDLLLAEQESGK